ncbi:MAG TPA: hypothetical protein VFS21_04375, partial [Roseiflexaceae bacterium]|nr:hypothetical protein [Roseiflexaceae bacterium]
MQIRFTELDLVNDAITQLMVGIGLALLNVLICYFFPRVPKVISVLRWSNFKRALIGAYVIALIIQLVTSPFFASAFQRVYTELAWSPYQAIFNVLGVLVIDLIVRGWELGRRGAQAGQQRLADVSARASEGLDQVGTRLGLSEEGRAEQAARRQAEAE